MMPDIYGLNVLESLKRDPNLSDIPVILQSGTSDYKEIDKAYKMGVVACIPKPYEKKIILELISKALYTVN
jgi:CheY-like chemotaxis protein